jgi:hypothetical protein
MISTRASGFRMAKIDPHLSQSPHQAGGRRTIKILSHLCDFPVFNNGDHADGKVDRTSVGQCAFEAMFFNETGSCGRTNGFAVAQVFQNTANCLVESEEGIDAHGLTHVLVHTQSWRTQAPNSLIVSSGERIEQGFRELNILH